MKKILENCQNEKELLQENHLKEFQRDPFSEFNLIIGKNGSGKTRMLNFLKDVANKRGECNIIFLDCTESSTAVVETSDNVLEALIFNEPLSRNSLANLFKDIQQSIPSLVSSMEDLCHEPSPRLSSRFASLLEKINKYLEIMLGRTLYIHEDRIYINNSSTGDTRELGQEINVLSPGERNIIIFSLALLCIQINVNQPSLLLIDEIETHLHPAVLPELLKMFRGVLNNKNCCVFIATHSVFLLPEFKFEEICYFEHGKLKKLDGNMYRDILNALVYGKEGNHSISELLISVDSWSYAEFMAECFQPPTVSDQVRVNDPQYQKMNQVVKRLLSGDEGKKLEVLDFGAGDARIGMCMKMDYESRTPAERPPINYHVYDKYGITEKFVSGEFVFGKKFETRESVATQKGKMDIVLLYNVLHEVGVDEWCDELNLALSLLSEEGVLIFSERKTLSIGEKPYGKSGYLVLGEEEIKILFSGMKIEEIELKGDMRRNTWGFAIWNPNGKEIIIDNVMKAIEKLISNTQMMIEKYYRQEVDPFKARDYAFYCQQYFNAREAYGIVEGKMIPNMKLQFIIKGRYSPQKKRYLLLRRAEIGDEEGKKCRRYLEDNHL